MGTAAKTPLEESIDKAITELETVADEIRVKVHLAGMDATHGVEREARAAALRSSWARERGEGAPRSSPSRMH